MATNTNIKAGPLGTPTIGANRAGSNYGGSGPKRTGLFSKGPIGLVVLGLHLVLIYAIAGSLGIVALPEFAKPMEAVFIDAPPEQRNEPVPIVKPALEQPRVETPPLEDTVPEIDVPTDEPAPNAITAQTSPSPPVAETADMKVNRRVDPAYPAGARRDGEQGVGMFRVLVDEKGKPMEVQVLKSSGFPRLDTAAMDAIRKWAFSPAMQNSQAVRSWTRVQVAFKLENAHG
ncbi:MAG: energy transducer TonB [Gammaproteobacteria bacterium]